MLLIFSLSSKQLELAQVSNLEYQRSIGRFQLWLDSTVEVQTLDRLLKNLPGSDDGFIEEIASYLNNGLANWPYFFILQDPLKFQIIISRDQSGIKTGYHTIDQGRLLIGSVANQLALATPSSKFDDTSVWTLLFTGFINASACLYENIHQASPGTTFRLDTHAPSLIQTTPLPIDFTEISCDYTNAALLLKSETTLAHKAISSTTQNTVLLSGGIDSAVMLASLSGTANLGAVTIRVDNTTQDETAYAKGQASHLGVPLEVVSINPLLATSRLDFEDTILLLNNQYIGIWLLRHLPANTPGIMFAGHDTRLHTPAINLVDRLLFLLGWWKQNWQGFFVRALLKPFKLFNASNHIRSKVSKFLRGLRRLGAAQNVNNYIITYFTHWNRTSCEGYKLPMANFEDIVPKIDFQQAHSPRNLYNTIVRYNWTMQYCFDMLYIQDAARLTSNRINLPFYMPKLTFAYSTLPWRHIIKFNVGKSSYKNFITIINKTLLRDSFKGLISPSVLNRDKATSNQLTELMFGPIGEVMREILHTDLKNINGFINSYGLGDTVNLFLTKSINLRDDVAFCVLIHYITALCTLQNRVILRGQTQP